MRNRLSLSRSHDTQPKRRYGRSEAAALFATALLAGGIGAGEALADASHDGQPPKGALINKGIFVNEMGEQAYWVTNNDISDCQRMVTGINHKGNPDKGIVYSPGTVYRVTTAKRSNRLTARMGIADIQKSFGSLTIDGVSTNHRRFLMSCGAALHITIRARLAKRNAKGKITTISAPAEGSSEGKRLEPVQEGFRSTGYLDRLLGYDTAKKGLRNTDLSWRDVSFKLPSDRGEYGVKVSVTATPDLDSPLREPDEKAATSQPRSRTTSTYTWVK
jgi:hypothetical protein